MSFSTLRDRTRAALVPVAVTTILLSQATAHAQPCPDWSSKFDQMDNGALVGALQQSRQQGWDNVIHAAERQGLSLSQQIAALEQTAVQMRSASQRDAQLWQQIGQGSEPRVTTLSCQNVTGAAMAAVCDQHLQQNGLLATEGTLDLLRCRATGLPAQSGTAYESVPLPSSIDTEIPSPNQQAYRMGEAASAMSSNRKRGQMVDSVTGSWVPPNTLSAPAGSLADQATLSDPFAQSVASREVSQNEVDGSSDSASVANTRVAAISEDDVVLGRSGASGSDGTQAPSGLQTSVDGSSASVPSAVAAGSSVGKEDVLVADSTGPAADSEPSGHTPTTNTRSVEGQTQPFESASIVAQDSSDSTQLHPDPALRLGEGDVGNDHPDPDHREPSADDGNIDLSASLFEQMNKHFNPNEASKKATEAGTKTVSTVDKDVFHIVDDLDAAQRGDKSIADINDDLERVPQDGTRSLLESAVPGLKSAEWLDRQIADVKQGLATSPAYKAAQYAACQFSMDPYCGKLGNNH